MPEDPQLHAIVTYLQTHRATHDRELLRQQLLHDGAPADLVDQAMEQVYGQSTAAPTNPAAPTSTPESNVGSEQSTSPSVSSMNNPAEVERIRSYLEQHRDTYDREALRRKLLNDGLAPQAVDLAFAQVYGLTIPAAEVPPDPQANRRPFLVTLFGVLLLNFVAGCTFSGIIFTLQAFNPSMFLLAALIPLEMAIMAYFWRRNHPVARGFMWALIGSLPVVAMGLLLGFCIGIVSSY